jgi:hypothetical protein
VLVNVVDDLVRDVVADALAPLPEEADLGGRNVVLNELRNNADVISELLELDQRIVYSLLVVFEVCRDFSRTDISATALQDECTVVTQNAV